MLTQHHLLPAAHAGTQRQLRSLHFGPGRSGRKAYLQASLHADEVPPMLVAQSLIQRLQRLEAEGAIEGRIVLVPLANPIGLSQELQGSALGRFDLATGLNFNRQFKHLGAAVARAVAPRLGDDLQANTREVRQVLGEQLAAWQTQTETEALKRQLQCLAHDADLVLDLHCDNQAVMHLYVGSAQVDAARPLAGYLGAQALLHTPLAGDEPFDETLARLWWELAEHFAGRHPIDPLGCVGLTVELRGETDVSQALADQDAQGLIAYLQQQGHVAGEAPPAPTACEPTPLEAVEPVTAPCAGIVVFAKAPGDWVLKGELVAEIVDPLTDERTPLHARSSGRCFARSARRYASRGMRLAKIAGHEAYRSGKLLSL